MVIDSDSHLSVIVQAFFTVSNPAMRDQSFDRSDRTFKTYASAIFKSLQVGRTYITILSSDLAGNYLSSQYESAYLDTS